VHNPIGISMTSLLDSISPTGQGPAISPQSVTASGLCIGCGSCVLEAEAAQVRMALDHFGQYKPEGFSARRALKSEQFSRICPFSPAAQDEDAISDRCFPTAVHHSDVIGRYEAAFVGYAAEGDYRSMGSSGGLVSWFAEELLRRGLVDGVAHVAPGHPKDGPLFRYHISRDVEALSAGAKSRYYPVELSAVLREISQVPGRYAIIGIPCFIKAVRLRCAEDPIFAQRVAFTMGLFCGHMKSARMAESFAWQLGSRIEDVDTIDYRVKDASRPANWYRTRIGLRDATTRERDWWHLVDGDWGAGFFQNSACNFCDDVVAETADISFGDAWLEPYSSDGRGTNVIIVREPRLLAITLDGIATGRIALSEVDEKFVMATQAAGFRHRREGLAFRLAWPRRGLCPKKRIAPSMRGLPMRRKAIYASRYLLSAWSHRVFWLAKRLHSPSIYLWWARGALWFYQGLAHSRGIVGRVLDVLGMRDTK
jgi:coenzyme F420-reducing hydrogenase beta subunit